METWIARQYIRYTVWKPPDQNWDAYMFDSLVRQILKYVFRFVW